MVYINIEYLTDMHLNGPIRNINITVGIPDVKAWLRPTFKGTRLTEIPR